LRVTESARTPDALWGAILGGLIALALSVLGFTDLVKVPGLSVLIPCMIVGTLLGPTAGRSILWAVGGALVALATVVAYTPITSSLIEPLIREDTVRAENIEAVAVLSAGMNADLLMGDQTLTRLLAGIALTRRHVGSAMIVSREHLPGRPLRENDSADQLHTLLLAPAGVPVYFADSVTSTRDEATRMRRIALAHGWTKIALVTSPLHTRRACATFEAVGFKVTCVAAPERDFPLSRLEHADDRIRAWRAWLYEMAGTVKYRSAGWMK
jgi:uncharacterized SAM-binding protein YcdF (DUF218 family)